MVQKDVLNNLAELPGSEMKCLLGVFMAGNMFVYERNVLDCMHCKVDVARI